MWDVAHKVWDSCTSWYRWPVTDPSSGAVTLTGNVYSLWPSSVSMIDCRGY